MSVPVTYRDALDALHKAVIDKGADYVYPQPGSSLELTGGRCMYFDKTGQSSCIVGHVLSQMGVAPFEYGQNINTAGVAQLFKDGILDTPDEPWVNSRTLVLLSAAQMYQDTGSSWGGAVESATKHVVNGLDLDHMVAIAACDQPA